MTDFLTLAKERYSVRSYRSVPVEQEKIDRILEAAHSFRHTDYWCAGFLGLRNKIHFSEQFLSPFRGSTASGIGELREESIGVSDIK